MLLGMESVADRLREARERAGYEDMTSAAEAFGWNIVTYRSHETGRRGFKLPTAQQYARAFNVSPEWILFGKFPSRPKSGTVPVLGYVGAGAEVILLDNTTTHEAGLEYVDAPPGAKQGIVAVRVKGESMVPAYRDGDLLFYSERTGFSPSDYRQERIVWLSDDRVFVKTILPGTRKDRVTLVSWNAEPILDAHVILTAKIEWIKRA